ncbi:uncharacterized protein [Diadema antillarum]|uniref:uncharacterized protein isoform X1 n=1 Tax=Diadema antillarum TaxID=105358 RepID=UPI003A8B12CC
MAAVNASPTHQEIRTTGQRDRQHPHRDFSETTFRTRTSNFIPTSTAHKVADSKYTDASSKFTGNEQTNGMMASDTRPHWTVVDHREDERLGTIAASAAELEGDRSSSMQVYEIQHLRVQVQSIGVLQDLLSDLRAENEALTSIVDSLMMDIRERGFSISGSVQERLSQLRLGSMSVPDTEWSVELKRPPYTSHRETERRDQQLQELTARLREKNEEVEVLQSEVDTLRQNLKSTNDEKAQEIARLTQLLHDSAVDRQSSAAICRSLSEETENLKARLHYLSEECRRLTAQLAAECDLKAKRPAERTTLPVVSDTPVSLEEQLRLTEEQVNHLERQKSELGTHLKEVVRMNKRWQRFNTKQEATITELVTTKNEVQSQKQVLERNIKDYEEAMSRLQERLQEMNDQQQHQQGGVGHAVAAARESTIRKLNKKVLDLEGEVTCMRQESSRYDMEVVKQQFKQFTEDFNKEHREKEKLKVENSILNRRILESDNYIRELSSKLDQADKEIKELKTHIRQLMQYIQDERNAPREGRELIPHSGGHTHVSLEDFPTLPRSVLRDGPQSFPLASSPAYSSFSSPPISPPTEPAEPATATASGKGRDEVDGPSAQDGSHAVDKLQASPSDGGEEPLQCPRCLREFPLNKHADLMRHTESCLDVD